MTELGISRIRPAIEHRQASRRLFRPALVQAIQSQGRGVMSMPAATAADRIGLGIACQAVPLLQLLRYQGQPWAKRADLSGPVFLAQVWPASW